MLDSILNAISNAGSSISPFLIVAEYERGVLLRCGKFLKVLEPGFHFKIPYFDKCLVDQITTNTLLLAQQSLVSADDVPVSVEAVLRYTIINIKDYNLNISDVQETLKDIGMGVVKQVIRDHGIKQAPDLDDTMTKAVRKQVKEFGIKVLTFKLVQISPKAKVIRLMQS